MEAKNLVNLVNLVNHRHFKEGKEKEEEIWRDCSKKYGRSYLFEDADNYHSESNKIKMASGIPLNDKDRFPWLDTLKAQINRWFLESTNVVLACSALRKIYREHITAEIQTLKPSIDGNACTNKDNIFNEKNPLVHRDEVCFIYLKGTREQLESQISLRKGHFMPTTLLNSQFEALEEPSFPEKYLTVLIRDKEEMIKE
eukprot:gene9829-10837_t